MQPRPEVTMSGASVMISMSLEHLEEYGGVVSYANDLRLCICYCPSYRLFLKNGSRTVVLPSVGTTSIPHTLP